MHSTLRTIMALLGLCLLTQNVQSQNTPNLLLDTSYVSQASESDIIQQIDKGAEVNQVEQESGRTPLLVLINHKRHQKELAVRLARIYIAAGANPNLPMERGSSEHPNAFWGYTPLHMAAHTANIEMVRLLLFHGAKPNTISLGNKFTPLYSAVLTPSMDPPELVRLLLEAGADPNYRVPSDGRTPLLQSILNPPKKPFVNSLLNYGADPTIPDNDGNTALSLTAEGFMCNTCTQSHANPDIHQRLIDATK